MDRAKSVSELGRSLLQKAFSTKPGSGAGGGEDAEDEGQLFVVTTDHTVPRTAEVAHGLLSVPRGSVVALVGGDPLVGLPAPYQDYVLVSYKGKTGKISKFVVRRKGELAGKSARTLVSRDAVLE